MKHDEPGSNINVTRNVILVVRGCGSKTLGCHDTAVARAGAYSLTESRHG